jgi:hypothetical protein
MIDCSSPMVSRPGKSVVSAAFEYMAALRASMVLVTAAAAAAAAVASACATRITTAKVVCW